MCTTFATTINRRGRELVVAFGFMVHVAAYFAVFVNIPREASVQPTVGATYIQTNVYVAMACSVALGLGDSCFKTQMYGLIGDLFKSGPDVAAIYAIYLFLESLTTAVSFFYANHVYLDTHLTVLVVSVTLATLAFGDSEWTARRSRKERVAPVVVSAVSVNGDN